MSVSGRTPKPSVLRLLQGSINPNTVEDRGDRPKIMGHPQVPPGVTLSEKEKLVWDFLIEHLFVPGVHGTGDGIVWLNAVRLYLRALDADEKVNTMGTLVRDNSGRLRRAPWVEMSQAAWNATARAISELGGTPVGRARVTGAPPTGSGSGWAGLGPPRGRA